MTIAIALPSRVQIGQFSFGVADGVIAIELLVKWPKPLVDLEMILRKFLNDTIVQYHPYHSKHFGFEEALKTC